MAQNLLVDLRKQLKLTTCPARLDVFLHVLSDLLEAVGAPAASAVLRDFTAEMLELLENVLDDKSASLGSSDTDEDLMDTDIE